MLKIRFRAPLLSYFRGVVLGGRGLRSERKILKFSVKIIKSGLSVENIMELEGLINVVGVVASEGIMCANDIFCGEDNVVKTFFRCLD